MTVSSTTTVGTLPGRQSGGLPVELTAEEAASNKPQTVGLPDELTAEEAARNKFMTLDPPLPPWKPNVPPRHDHGPMADLLQAIRELMQAIRHLIPSPGQVDPVDVVVPIYPLPVADQFRCHHFIPPNHQLPPTKVDPPPVAGPFAGQ